MVRKETMYGKTKWNDFQIIHGKSLLSVIGKKLSLSKNVPL
jgi:hypothetical protein